MIPVRDHLPDLVIGDAFGRALRDCHEAGAQAGQVFEVVERDDGWIGVSDAAAYFAPLTGWPELERNAYPEITGRVLDVGCGAGRHAQVLTAGGREVVGIDSSPGAVDVARARGVDARQASVRALPTTIPPVDVVLLFGTNVALLGGEREAPAVLEELARVAAPGARVIASGTDPYATANSAHLAYHDRNRERGRLPGHLRLRVRHGRLATEWFDYVFRSEAELRGVVADSPWRWVGTRRTGSGGYVMTAELH